MTWQYYKCSNPGCDRISFSGWCCIYCYYGHKAKVERGKKFNSYHNSDCDLMQERAKRRIATGEAVLRAEPKYGPDEWAERWREWEEDENY